MTSSTIGIDLGTSKTCVAFYLNDRPEVILNRLGNRVTPSVVAFQDDGNIDVGELAARQAIMNPLRTITLVKRLMGQPFHSPDIETIRSGTSYSLIEGHRGDAWIKIGNEELSPSTIQAHILATLRIASANFLSEPVRDAVITVPAFFNESQRQATRNAAIIAGLNPKRILNESTAAALAYGYAAYDNRTVTVVDLGGGTLDITIMRVDQGQFTTIATAGDILLGGTDFDRTMVLRWGKQIESETGARILSEPSALQRLVGEAERAKKQLSDFDEVNIDLPHLARSPQGPVDFRTTLSRKQFQDFTRPLIERVARFCIQAMEEAGVTPRKVDDVILVGGMAHAPMVQERITTIFERRPLVRVNPDEAVALGAAVLGGILDGRLQDSMFADVAPSTIGFQAANNQYMPWIRRSSPLPFSLTRQFPREPGRSTSVKLYQGENPVASKNRELATISLPEISTAVSDLSLTLAMNEEGLISASATQSDTGAPVVTQLLLASGLEQDEMVRLATEMAARYPTNPSLASARDNPANGAEFPRVSFASTEPRKNTASHPTLPPKATESIPRAPSLARESQSPSRSAFRSRTSSSLVETGVSREPQRFSWLLWVVMGAVAVVAALIATKLL